jgi:hypothetical protein
MYRRRIQDVAQYVRANTQLWAHAPWHDKLPGELLGGIDRIVYIIRDPRDVLVSGAHFVDSGYCRREFGIPRVPLAHRYRRLLKNCAEWAVHVAGWLGHARDSGLHIVSYEALVADLPYQLQRLARYLGLDLGEAQLQRVADQVVFRAMRSTADSGHVRQGLVGNWKIELPEEVAREATRICSPLLQMLGFEGNGEALSRFLTDGEISPSLLAELERINALQGRAAPRAAPPAGEPGTAFGSRVPFWR